MAPLPSDEAGSAVMFQQTNFAILSTALPDNFTDDTDGEGLFTLQVDLNSPVSGATDFSQLGNDFIRVNSDFSSSNPPAFYVLLNQEVLDFYLRTSNSSNGPRIFGVAYQVNSSLFQDPINPGTGGLVFTLGQAQGPAPSNLTTPVQFIFEPSQVYNTFFLLVWL